MKRNVTLPSGHTVTVFAPEILNNGQARGYYEIVVDKRCISVTRCRLTTFTQFGEFMMELAEAAREFFHKIPEAR